MDEQQAADSIADAFEAGVAPWSRSDRLGVTCGLPMDARTGQPFRGVEIWLLELAAIVGEYRSPYWASRRGWSELGAVVIRGEGTTVIDDGERKGTVEKLLYNLEQVEVRPDRSLTSLDRFRVLGKVTPDCAMARRLLDASGAKVVADGCCRCVVFRDGREDFIGMLPVESFGGDLDRYWSAMFHELTHWVVLRSRRDCWNRDPSPGELVAMFGASILATRCGIPMCGDLDPACDLVLAWIGEIRRDHRYLSLALKVAELAAAVLLCQAGYET